MQDILTDIIRNTRQEVNQRKSQLPVSRLMEQCAGCGAGRSMRQALAESPTGIIAEFKRRSPSKGWIKADGDSTVIPRSYQMAGATALSVLTDSRYFGGNLDDLRAARRTVDIPILRKDFIIDEYQLYEAKAAGADAVLLIAAALTREQCGALAVTAHGLGLEVLLEIHSEDELPYITGGIDMVGVNNRNLGTFHTDVANSHRIAGLLPKHTVLVSESGISDSATLKGLRQAGFRGFLIGEMLMKTPDPGKTLAGLITDITDRV